MECVANNSFSYTFHWISWKNPRKFFKKWNTNNSFSLCKNVKKKILKKSNTHSAITSWKEKNTNMSKILWIVIFFIGNWIKVVKDQELKPFFFYFFLWYQLYVKYGEEKNSTLFSIVMQINIKMTPCRQFFL